MGIAHQEDVSKHGASVQRHPRTEHNVHQVEAQEPQELGSNVGEFGYDRPDEGDQGTHFISSRYILLLHPFAVGSTWVTKPKLGRDDFDGVPQAVDCR